MSDQVRVLLVDDQEIVRSGLRAFLERADDLRVVGEAGDGVAALDFLRAHRVDVVVMDIRMPRLDGIAATERIIGDPAMSGVRVLVLTTFDTDDNLFDALAVGASGFLTKDSDPDTVRQAVRTVAAGASLLAPEVTRRVIDRATSIAAVDHSAVAAVDALTERERDVLVEVTRGLSNDEIAQRLHLSPATSRTYVSRLLAKLGARDRVALVILGHRAGLGEHL